MSKRGKELAEKMATRHLELSGVSKAHGSVQHAELAEFYRPFGEGAATLEKTSKIQRKTAELASTILARGERLLEQEKIFLDRAEAFSASMAQPRVSTWGKSRFDEYRIPSTEQTIPQANGYHDDN